MMCYYLNVQFQGQMVNKICQHSIKTKHLRFQVLTAVLLNI